MSNETYDKLCKKHGLDEKAKVEFKSYFEKEIIKVFNRNSADISKEPTKESTAKKITTKPKTVSSDDICTGKKADGNPCTFKAKEGGYCGRHNPDKTVSTKTASKPRVKKDSRECHAVILKTGKKCISAAHVKPDGSDFYYCKRHSEKWIDFEQEPEPEQELGQSDVEEEEEVEVEEEQTEEAEVEEEQTEEAEVEEN